MSTWAIVGLVALALLVIGAVWFLRAFSRALDGIAQDYRDWYDSL